MYLKLRYFSEYMDKTRQDNLIIFSTDKNTIKDPTPLVEKCHRRKKNKRNLVISVQEKKRKRKTYCIMSLKDAQSN